jgi:branched-chain amino acid transport system ATP-binding protein
MTVLQVEKLSKSFGGITAVNNVSFDVREGEILGIIGPNGSGKSTLFNCVLGQLTPSSGEVRVDGKVTTGMRPCDINRIGVSRTFQLLQVFPQLSVRDNLILAGQEHRGSMFSRLVGQSDAGLTPTAEQMISFFRLSHLADEQAGLLSYGQQKLLDAAMAFMAGPRLVLLDEPAGGVNLTMLGNLRERLQAYLRCHRTPDGIRYGLVHPCPGAGRGSHYRGRKTGRSAARSGRDRSLSRALIMSAVEPILTLDSVVAGYGKMTILNGTTSHIRSGGITTVVGPNGAGKSTMFKAIFGLLPVRHGKIFFAGCDTTNAPPRKMLDAGMVYIPQGRNIFPELSVQHNLELGGTALPDQAELAARVESLMERFPLLKDKANAQASTLSGGQQKILEVARGLLLNPKLILIDEPSIGLSPIMVQEVFGILKDLREKGVTILLIEQNAKQALKISDYGIVLEQGQTRIEDTAQNILGDPRIAQLFLGGGLAPAEATA